MKELEKKYELFHKNMGLPKFTLRKYFNTLTFDEDLVQVANLALWNACLNFDESRGMAFSTYAVKSIRIGVIAEINSRQKEKQLKEVVLENEEKDIRLMAEPFSVSDKILEIEIPYLDEREKEIVRLRLNDESCTEIGDKLGISRQRVHKILQSISEKIKKHNEEGI